MLDSRRGGCVPQPAPGFLSLPSNVGSSSLWPMQPDFVLSTARTSWPAVRFVSAVTASLLFAGVSAFANAPAPEAKLTWQPSGIGNLVASYSPQRGILNSTK